MNCAACSAHILGMEPFPWLATPNKPLAVPAKTPAYAKKERQASFQASRPAKTVRISALLKDLVLAADKTCCLCLLAPATMVNRLVPPNLGGANTYDNLIGSCRPCTDQLAGRPIEESGMRFVLPPRFARREAKPAWIDDLPLLLILSDTLEPSIGTVLFGYRVSTTTGRLKFEAVSITVPHRSNRQSIPLEELPVHLYPKRSIASIASWSNSKLSTLSSSLNPPEILIESLPEVAQAFPQEPDITVLAQCSSGWKAISDSPSTVPGTTLRSTKPTPVKVRAQTTDSKEAKLERHRAMQVAIKASRTLQKKRRSVPHAMTKYLPPVPHVGDYLLIEDFWEAERHWRKQFDALWMIPTIPAIGMLVPHNLRDDPPSKTMRKQILRTEKQCRYCMEALATTLDHIFPRCFGGKSTFDNLVGACKACNTEKGDQLLPIEGMTLHLPERFSNPGAMPNQKQAE